MARLKEGLGYSQAKASNLSENQNHNKNQSNTENQIQNNQHKHMSVGLWPCITYQMESVMELVKARHLQPVTSTEHQSESKGTSQGTEFKNTPLSLLWQAHDPGTGGNTDKGNPHSCDSRTPGEVWEELQQHACSRKYSSFPRGTNYTVEGRLVSTSYSLPFHTGHTYAAQYTQHWKQWTAPRPGKGVEPAWYCVKATVLWLVPSGDCTWGGHWAVGSCCAVFQLHTFVPCTVSEHTIIESLLKAPDTFIFMTHLVNSLRVGNPSITKSKPGEGAPLSVTLDCGNHILQAPC